MTSYSIPASHHLSRRAIFALASCAAISLTGCEKRAPASFKGLDLTGAPFGKSFSMTDMDGKIRSLPEFKGKIVMLFFGFTQCPDVCPTALGRAAEVRRLLGDAAEKLQVIFVTIDPDRDTPNLLRNYVRAFDPSFIALGGDTEATSAIAKEFKIFYQKVTTGNSYTMDHTTLTYILDTQGILRLAMKHEQTAAEFAADIKSLLS
jgi:protein SCO1/2